MPGRRSDNSKEKHTSRRAASRSSPQQAPFFVRLERDHCHNHKTSLLVCTIKFQDKDALLKVDHLYSFKVLSNRLRRQTKKKPRKSSQGRQPEAEKSKWRPPEYEE